MKISVIIPVYNAEKYLAECLDSVFNQDFDDFEVICVNDGSTDSSLEILGKYTIKHKNLRILSQKNSGPGYSRKVGLNVAQGDYIYFMDADDCLEQFAFSEMFENINRNGSDFALLDFYLWDHNKNEKSKSDYIKRSIKDKVSDEPENFCFKHNELPIFTICFLYAPWLKIYRKSFLDKYDNWYFPKKTYYEDVPFHVQTFLLAEKISLISKPLISYRLTNPSSITNQTQTQDRLFDIFPIVEKEFSLIDEFGFTELYLEKLLYHALAAFDLGSQKLSEENDKREFYHKAGNFLSKYVSVKDVLVDRNMKDLFDKYTLYDNFREADLQEMRRKNAVIVQQNDSLKQDIENLKQEIKNLNKTAEDLKNSYSFRIGRAVIKTISAPLELFKRKKNQKKK